VPSGHLSHKFSEVAPIKVEYLPATQLTQTASETPAAPEKYVPFGQSWHVLPEIAPHTVEYLPG
jgi:hypothetical protein